MSNITRPQTGVDQRTPGNVLARFSEVVLDGRAIHAVRLALLAELVAEQFRDIRTVAAESGQVARPAAAWHLERAAQLARAAADRERARCTAVYGVPGACGGPTALRQESA